MFDNFNNNLPAFFEGLEIMGFGMAGIFIVLLLIFVSIKALIKFFPSEN
jgi:Na+-transporting methylmalonyl-CoA/oxaloacetate decarboxylase gamma subunit